MLEAQNIQKRYGPAAVLTDVSLRVAPGETLAVLGRSGCGKTTLLKILAGLLPADAGEVHVNGQRIDALPPQARGVIYLYQEPLLFPHLDVWENVAFGLRLRRLPAAEVNSRTAAMLAQLSLSDHARKMPEKLSGGQRQRVAFGRALIIQPPVLLLDEPFGSLDPETRAEMQELYREVAGRQQIAALFVTHDLREALSVGQRFALMEAGALFCFENRQDFARDPRSGVSREAAFWREME